MKAEDIKAKTPDELKKMLLDLYKEQFNLRFQKSGGSLENTAQLRRTRRSIARAKTFLNEKAGTEETTAKKATKKASKKAA